MNGKGKILTISIAITIILSGYIIYIDYFTYEGSLQRWKGCNYRAVSELRASYCGEESSMEDFR